MIGAFLYYRATNDRNWPPALAWLVALGVPALLGALTHVLVMSRLRRASSLVRVVATLSVFFLALAVANDVWGSQGTPVRSPLPDTAREFLGAGNGIPEDRLWLVAIAVAVTAALAAVFRWTRFGHATDAAAENPVAAAALGYSPDRIAIVNWALGGMLAAAAGVLIAPILFLSVAALGVHRVAWVGGGARRVVPLVLVDARRCVRDRRRRIDAQPLPREQGHLRTGRLRGRAVARHVHVRRGLPLVGIPAHRRRDGCRGSLVATAKRAPRSPPRGRDRARLEDRYRRGARRHDRGADARSRRLDAAARDQHGDRDRLSVARRRHRVRGTTVARPDGPRRLWCVGGRSIRHVVRLAVPPRRHRRRAHRDSRRSARRAARLADRGASIWRSSRSVSRS